MAHTGIYSTGQLGTHTFGKAMCFQWSTQRFIMVLNYKVNDLLITNVIDWRMQAICDYIKWLNNYIKTL